MLGIRLKTLREELGLKQEDLAKKLSVSPSAIGMYERDLREPNNELMLKIANFFDVSVDYLLGKTDIRNNKETFDKSKLYFALSKEDEGYISDDLKDRILEFAKFAIEQEKKKKGK